MAGAGEGEPVPAGSDAAGLREEAPVFSVIIATYNWSSALRLAIQSVLNQTFGDFELLVVGDACTDDSAEVVAAFGDHRIIWHNLAENCGSQWGPNNYGLSVARGRYIAYLGHDDLWWPTHLAAAQGMLTATGADIVAAGTIMYGPPHSDIRAVTGFFPNGTFNPRHFFPPSSMVHCLEISRRVGGWLSPDLAMAAVDVDFLNRCHQAGAKIVGTGEITTFKFNAAWRRNSYRWRDAQEQREFLARMGEEGEPFRLRQLTGALRSAALDQLQKIEVSPQLALAKATESAAINHAFKGTRRQASKLMPILVDGRQRYPVAEGYAGFEWSKVEEHPKFGKFRWSGPARRSTIVLPVATMADFEIRLLVIHAIAPGVLKTLLLSINGLEIEAAWGVGPQNEKLLCGKVMADQIAADDRSELRITLEVENTWRPMDLGVNQDRRWLGVAVGWVEIGPLPGVNRSDPET